MNAPAHRFAGRVALITGASRGIGLAIASRIVAEGGRVCVTGRKPEPLGEAVASLGGDAVAMGVPGTADDAEHRALAIEAAVDRFGAIDVLVNNTGINPIFGPLMDAEPDAFRKILEVNVLSSLAWTRAALDAGLRAASGAVVNVASVAGQRPAGGIGAYGASKAALLHLTQQLAIELARLSG